MTLTYSTKPKFDEPAIEFTLPGTDDQTYSLADFQAAKALVVIFTCNHCPYAQAVRPTLIEIANQYAAEGIAFVAINPNDETSYPLDSLEHMREERYDYPFPYLRDATQEVAKAYGAVCTPDIFVYDGERKLAYHGRVNDNWQEPEKVTSHDLRDALEALLRKQRPNQEQHPSMGCSIKWRTPAET